MTFTGLGLTAATIVFLPQEHAPAIVAAAAAMRDVERGQALAMANGHSLRDQLRFREYLARRDRDPQHSFRQHLREIGRAIEK